MGDFAQGGFGPGTYVTELIYGGLHTGELLLGAYVKGTAFHPFYHLNYCIISYTRRYIV